MRTRVSSRRAGHPRCRRRPRARHTSLPLHHGPTSATPSPGCTGRENSRRGQNGNLSVRFRSPFWSCNPGSASAQSADICRASTDCSFPLVTLQILWHRAAGVTRPSPRFNRTLISSLLLGMLLLRAYVPVGFMPASGRPFEIELCSAALSMEIPTPPWAIRPRPGSG